MPDSDVVFCEQQIKLQEGKIQELVATAANLDLQFEMMQAEKARLKKDFADLNTKIQKLDKQIANERCILGQLRHHKRELERIKTWERIQHSSVEKRSKK